MNIATLTRESVPPLPTFGIDPDAEQTRNELLLASRECKTATTVTEANSVGEAARDLRTFIASVRDLGIGLRRPLRSATEQIKRVEDDYLMPLEAEQGRLEALASAWAAQERRRVAAEQEARAAEIARLAAEQEAARSLATASDTPKDVVAAMELAESATATLEAAVRAPLPEPVKVAGMSTRRVMRVEVTDIHALYKAAPHLVRLEANLAAIKSTCFPEHPVPGLRLTYEEATTTRRW
jgi:chemotaxis protein histidine kinase CheA